MWEPRGKLSAWAKTMGRTEGWVVGWALNLFGAVKVDHEEGTLQVWVPDTQVPTGLDSESRAVVRSEIGGISGGGS